MWIKASGTALADAEATDIFVAVDRAAARAEACGNGDGRCKTTVLDKSLTLRPSIETTFHTVLDAGSYYPDHGVFLDPALPVADHDGTPPAVLLREDAIVSQRAMLRCLADLLARLPDDCEPQPIGAQAEADLPNRDAEKDRQALAART